MNEIKEIMSKPLRTVKVGTTLTEAQDVMSTYRLRHLPVVDEFSDIVGIVSQRDLQKQRGADVRIELLMSNPVKYVDQNSKLRPLILTMLEQKISCVVVRNGKDNPVGIITTDDILCYVTRLSENEIEGHRSLFEIFSLTTVNEVIKSLAVWGFNF